MNHRFTARISATALFHVAHERLSAEIREEFKKSFIKLCADDTPMVRRMAAENFEKFSSKFGVQEIQDSFLPPFNKLSNDDQDSVRIQAIKICISFAKTLPVELKVCMNIIFEFSDPLFFFQCL